MYASASSAQSACSTQSTPGKSKPRAAMSVAKRAIAALCWKLWNTAMRFICFILPCSIASGTPGRSFRNASYTNVTCRLRLPPPIGG